MISLELLLAILVPPASRAAEDGIDGLGLTTVCIDAGHGGHDPGCISRDGSRTQEKIITLSIAGYLSEMIQTAYPEVRVVRTRSDDSFVELAERADIANRNGANLFISIHVNSLDPKNNKNWAAVRGFSVHCLGQSRSGKDLYSYNMDLVKRENSVILLEDDYGTKYQGFDPSDPESYIFFNLMQNANLGQSLDFASCVVDEMSKGPIGRSRGLSQDPFYVLWKTTMPAVLIEVGFITNSSDLAVMKTEKGRKGIAADIFRAFVAFKKNYDASLGVGNEALATSGGVQAGAASHESGDPVLKADSKSIVYGTQILASSKSMPENDGFFKGYTPTIVKSGKLYKYIIGTSEDIDTARETYKKLKSSYKDSFLVGVDGERVVRIR